MAWIWTGWAALAAALLTIASAMERSMIVNRIDGANGLTLFMSHLLVAAGSTAVVVLTWLLRDASTAAIVALVAAASQGLAWRASLAVLTRVGTDRSRSR